MKEILVGLLAMAIVAVPARLMLRKYQIGPSDALAFLFRWGLITAAVLSAAYIIGLLVLWFLP